MTNKAISRDERKPSLLKEDCNLLLELVSSLERPGYLGL